MQHRLNGATSPLLATTVILVAVWAFEQRDTGIADAAHGCLRLEAKRLRGISFFL
jgi:hypothetical protein